MDYQLDNVNLSLNEKNKMLLTDLKASEKFNENNFMITASFDDDSEVAKGISTFQIYSSFIQEKEALLKITKEICLFSEDQSLKIQNGASSTNQYVTKIEELIEFKNRIIMILNIYQEQPGLLDPILEELLRPLSNSVLVTIQALLNMNKDKNLNLAQIEDPILMILKCLCQIVYVICKVRGYETVIKYFSSEVQVFEPIISFLLQFANSGEDSWQTIYVLTLWTSILGLIPFDIDTVDTSGLIINSLTTFYISTLSMSSNLREIAGFSASRFLTRKDIIAKGLLDNYINWCISTVKSQQENTSEIFLIVGIFASLSKIFKNGSSIDLEPYIPLVTQELVEGKLIKIIENSNLVRKYRTRLSEKIGLCILKPKNQLWRYRINIKEMMTGVESLSGSNDVVMDEGTYIKNFEIVEIIIGSLLEGITDKDSIVRWTAAKGIGRLSERLDQEMVHDILNVIFENLNSHEEGHLQGSCLAIAELAKRGLIIPEKLHQITTLLNKVLIFEVNKGGFCTGSNVRDSACYVVWALARAYSPSIMKEHVLQLSTSLILTILFDKEVNIRRAASAAFQEHVGRQGFFPHGIEIITEADYFTLGNRTNCYLNISLFISQYKEYYYSIVDYISNDRLYHSDLQIRQNAAESLGLLVPFDHAYFIQNVIKSISGRIFSPNVNTRHGALLGIGYILVGLSGKWDYEFKSRLIRLKILETLSQSEKKVLEDSDYRKQFEDIYFKIKYCNSLGQIEFSLLQEVLGFPNQLNEKGILKAKGAELMKGALNNFIRLIAISQVNIEENNFFEFVAILIDSLKHPIAEVQEEASNSLSILMDQYYPIFANQHDEQSSNLFKIRVNSILKEILHLSVADESVIVTRGFTQAIPSFNINALEDQIQIVVNSLVINSKVKSTENNDADTKGLAIQSLSILLLKLLNKNFNLDIINSSVELIFDTIIEAFNDYQIDTKLGDVGSKSREKSIQIFPSLMLTLAITNQNHIFEKYILKFMQNILKQLSEKMNKIRSAAGNALNLFLRKFESLDQNNTIYAQLKAQIPHYDDLYQNFVVKPTQTEDYSLNSTEHDKIKEITLQQQKAFSNGLSLIETSNDTQWLEPNFTFPLVIPFINFEVYSYSVFAGLIFSLGGITEDVISSSLESFENLMSSNSDIVETVYKHIISLFEKNKKNDIVITHLYTSLNVLLTKPYFMKSCYLGHLDVIQKLIINENLNSSNIIKMLKCPSIYYNILFFEKEENFKCHTRAMRSLLFLMAHKFPVVRKKAAEKLYLYLLTIEDPEFLGIDQDTLDNCGLILAETDWTLSIKEITPYRNSVAGLLLISLK